MFLQRTLVAGLLGLAGMSAHGQTVGSMTFDITNDSEYQTLRGAIMNAEYVRFDFVHAPNPRLAAVVTGTLAFTTRNPLATDADVASFLSAYNAALQGAAPGDPDLRRQATFLAVVRSTRIAMAGFDTRVAGDVLASLDLEVPGPDGFAAMQSRMVQYDEARFSSLSNSAAWNDVLVLAFAGQDLDGNVTPQTLASLFSFVESEGFEPVPDGIDDGRFTPVTNALATLPANFAAFSVLQDDTLAQSAEWTAVTTSLAAVSNRAQARVTDIIEDAGTTESLLDGIDAGQDDDEFDAIIATYETELNEVAADRTRLAMNTILLMQNADPGIRALAQRSRDFSGIQLQNHESLTGLKAGLSYVGGIGGAASANPGAFVAGVATTATAIFDLSDAMGEGESDPSAEQQLFDQMIEIRQQIESMQAELNGRFDRIEAQLNTVYTQLASGLNAIQGDITQLQLDVDALSSQVLSVRATLERIEAALLGVAEDLLLADLTILTDALLGYRADVAADLPYNTGPDNFNTGASSLHSWATSISKGTPLAGLDASFAVTDASAILDGQPYSRNINGLRRFPTELGLPLLAPTTVAAPAAWAQSASAYHQLCVESPWYFAVQANNGKLDEIIATGEALQSMADAARAGGLFPALFTEYQNALNDLAACNAEMKNARLAPKGVDMWDPWGGPIQSAVTSALASPSTAGALSPNSIQRPLPTFNNASWKILGDQGSLATDVAAFRAAMDIPGTPTVSIDWDVDSNGFLLENDLRMRFRVRVDGDDGANPQFVGEATRTLVMEMTSFGSPVLLFSDGAVADRFTDTLTLWINTVIWFTNGENLEGQSLSTFDGDGDQITLHVTHDAVTDDFIRPLKQRSAAFTDQVKMDLYDDFMSGRCLSTDAETIHATIGGVASLLDAYTAFAIPELIESSTIAAATLRGNTGPDGLSIKADVASMYDAAVPNAPFLDLPLILGERAAIAETEIDEARAMPSTASGTSTG